MSFLIQARPQTKTLDTETQFNPSSLSFLKDATYGVARWKIANFSH